MGGRVRAVGGRELDEEVAVVVLDQGCRGEIADAVLVGADGQIVDQPAVEAAAEEGLCPRVFRLRLDAVVDEQAGCHEFLNALAPPRREFLPELLFVVPLLSPFHRGLPAFHPAPRGASRSRLTAVPDGAFSGRPLFVHWPGWKAMLLNGRPRPRRHTS